MDTRQTAVTTPDRVRRAAETVEVPEGWELLPATGTRTIRANRKFIDRGRGGPWLVDGREVLDVRTLGPVRFVAEAVPAVCGKAHLETDGPVLVRPAA